MRRTCVKVVAVCLRRLYARQLRRFVLVLRHPAIRLLMLSALPDDGEFGARSSETASVQYDSAEPTVAVP